MFVTVILLKYALLVSWRSYEHFFKLTQFYLNNAINLRIFDSTHYIVLYPQNGDHIMTIDSVTSLHPVCSSNSS